MGMSDRARQPQGVPVGGQFAAQAHPEADLDPLDRRDGQPGLSSLAADLLRRDVREALETAGISGVLMGHERVRAVVDAMMAAAATELAAIAEMEPVTPPLGMFSDEGNRALDEAIRPLEVACFEDRAVTPETSSAVATVLQTLAAEGHGEALDTAVSEAVWQRFELAARRPHHLGPPHVTATADTPPTV
jgi:hypothetical protein